MNIPRPTVDEIVADFIKDIIPSGNLPGSTYAYALGTLKGVLSAAEVTDEDPVETLSRVKDVMRAAEIARKQLTEPRT